MATFISREKRSDMRTFGMVAQNSFRAAAAASESSAPPPRHRIWLTATAIFCSESL